MDTAEHSDADGDKRQATLRRRVASLTATACRGASPCRGGCAGEGAR
ncbi:DUF6380 family protein [Streptomyces chromofuscus]|nr:hypothetical protein GCM10010254_26750 [Streptomyces chromofuscus]